MYVDFEYYVNVFCGKTLPEQDFLEFEREAETYIRYLTYLNGDIFADTEQEKAVKGAVCAAADIRYAAFLELRRCGTLKSESKDGLSVSFVTPRKDGETEESYMRRCMYQGIRVWLLPTGWLSRRGKAGGTHGHECGCCDCL